MSHAVADCFEIENRGYIREGYFADLVVVDTNTTINSEQRKYFIQMRMEPFRRIYFSGNYRKNICKRQYGLWKRGME